MRLRTPALILTLAALALPLRADDPPLIEHQPVPCTIAGKAASLCATVTDDNEVAKARVYFKRQGEEYFAFVDMVFGGINYCGTIPAPREGKVKAIEYYIQAVDNAYQAQRISTYQMTVQPEGVCEFPPLEKDPARAAKITVFATHKKQGKKLDDAFVTTGVTFVPVADK